MKQQIDLFFIENNSIIINESNKNDLKDNSDNSDESIIELINKDFLYTDKTNDIWNKIWKSGIKLNFS